MTHLISLSTRETIPLDGGGFTSKVTRVIEGRTTHLFIHLLLLLSLAFAPALTLIPRTVLYGVFLFMGVGSSAPPPKPPLVPCLPPCRRPYPTKPWSA